MRRLLPILNKRAFRRASSFQLAKATEAVRRRTCPFTTVGTFGKMGDVADAPCHLLNRIAD